MMSNSRGVHDGQRKREAEIAALCDAFKQGEKSGAPIPASEVFDRLETKYARMAAGSEK
jgi:alpha-D-ribose 1-methylphosphonate 5-triphosphate synthase subunit PhnG